MSEILVTRSLEQIISKIRPGHHEVTWVEGGDNREVAVVDNYEVFRFPKEEEGKEVSRYEYEVLELLQGRLSIEIPKPIELASDGSYNILSFLPGKVLSKQAVTELPFKKRQELGVAIGGVINELNQKVSRGELNKIRGSRPLTRNRDSYYAAIYEIALHQNDSYSTIYRDNYERLQKLRPKGSGNDVIVFGDLSSPNLVLSDNDKLIGLIDWTELGLGDVHNELRPVFSVIGQQAFESMMKGIESVLGPIDQDLVRLLAVVHESAVLVGGKQKGTLTPERIKLAIASVEQWLGKI